MIAVRSIVIFALVLAPRVFSWQTLVPASHQIHKSRVVLPARPSSSALNLFFADEDTKTTTTTTEKPTSTEVDDQKKTSAVDATTEKYGLEAGLFQSLRSGDGGESAKSLLKKYGIAYLATSIPLAILSFAFFYFLVDAGVDVSALLAKVGIENAATAEKAGTVAIAYAAHKAASPIRFPPTVLLTPIVANLIGKEPNEEEDEETETEGEMSS